jgi:hypothetical protein
VRGRRQGLDSLYRSAAAHGAGVMTSWPTALGFPHVVGPNVRTWPHRSVLLTAGVSTNAMSHSGRNS